MMKNNRTCICELLHISEQAMHTNTLIQQVEYDWYCFEHAKMLVD